MKYLLYLSPTERQLWGRDGKNWLPVSGEPDGPVWVVTDLVGESFAEIKTPRLFGRDRTSYVARQLATRYPDTPYRTCLTPPQEGDLMGKLVPTRHILVGVDAAERINAELDATTSPVAGVWPVSMLLSLLGQARDLPADLFVVLPAAGTLRIVFLKDRTPVLTRLTLTPNQVGAQVEEIVRTQRHLENTLVLPRGSHDRSVLLLGDPAGFEGPLAAAHLKLVTLHRDEDTRSGDWHFPLFDLALKSPAGQVAPLTRRVDYLGIRLGKAAVVLAAVILVAGIGSAMNNLWSFFGMISESHQLNESIRQIDERIAGVQLAIGKFGVAPDTVRRAVAMHEDEIVSVPGLDQHFRLIANVLASDPNLRLANLQWRLLAPGGLPCSVAAADQAANGTAGPQPGSDKRRAELSFELAVPVTYGPRDRGQVLRSVSGALSGIAGLTLWQDAHKDLASGILRGGSTQGAATKLTWCMTLPGVAGTPDGPGGGFTS
ncbi:MAG: hypothetical protein OEL20_11235 [Sulfuritalea sp.]|nr:hypothetical protein [Sulfuritalea sp.]